MPCGNNMSKAFNSGSRKPFILGPERAKGKGQTSSHYITWDWREMEKIEEYMTCFYVGENQQEEYIIHIKFFPLPPPTFPPFPIHILHCKQEWVGYMLFCSGRSLFLAMFQSFYLYLAPEVILILSIKIKGYYQLSRNMLALKLLIYWELSSQIWLDWEPYRLQLSSCFFTTRL